MKYLVRRITVGIAILSFFLPWFDGFFSMISRSGFSLALDSLKVGDLFGSSDLKIIGIFLLIVFGLAIWTCIQPKRIPTILFLVVSTLTVIVLFGISELSNFLGAGVYLFAISVIGVYVSLFIKEQDKSPRPATAGGLSQSAATEHAATVADSVVKTETPKTSVRKFCGECGNKLTEEHKFCKECGWKVV